MKRNKVSKTILLSIFVYILFLLPFFSKVYLKVINPVFWIVMFIYTKKNYDDIKIKDKYNKYYASLSYYVSLIFVIIFFLLGFVCGFKTLNFNHSFIEICKNIFFFGFAIVSEEYVRYYLVNKSIKGTPLPILSMFSFIILDLILYYFIYDYTILKHIIFSIVPIIVRNMLCTYFASKKTLYSSYVIRLFPVIILLLIPVMPKINPFLMTIFELVYYIVLYIVNKRASENLKSIDKKIRVNKYKSLKFIILTLLTIVTAFIIGLFNYVPMAVKNNDLASKLSYGDYAIYKKVDNINELNVDDIIIFVRDSKILIRYVDDIMIVNDETILTTRSDIGYDKEVVEKKDIIGVYKFKIAYLGYPSAFLNQLLDKEG